MTVPVITPENHADSPVEIISPDVSLQWIDGGRILVTRSAMHDPAAYDRWDSQYRAILDEWPPDRIFCNLYDFRSPRFGVTLYTGTKIRQIGQDYSHLISATAFVHSHTGASATLVATIKMIPFGERSVREFFTDYDQAVVWLKAQFDAAISDTNPSAG